MSGTIRTPRNVNGKAQKVQAPVVQEEEFDFQSMSVQEWAEYYGWTEGISNVITLSKENQYPMITFLHATEKYTNPTTGKKSAAAVNIFFSVSASENAPEGTPITLEFLEQFQMCYVTCNAAESGYAWKLCNAGSGGKYQKLF